MTKPIIDALTAHACCFLYETFFISQETQIEEYTFKKKPLILFDSKGLKRYSIYPY